MARLTKPGRRAIFPAKRNLLRVALLALLAGLTLLCGCGYLPVEEPPIRVGDAIVVITPQPTR